MNLYALSVNHRVNPLGINSAEQPYFGWKLKSRTQCKPHIAYGSMQTIRFASTVGGWKQHATLLFAVLIFCDRKHSTAGQ